MAKDFESIKQRIDALKAKKAKCEGRKEAIEQQWRDEWGLKDRESVVAKIEELKKKESELQAAQDGYLAKADAILTAAGV